MCVQIADIGPSNVTSWGSRRSTTRVIRATHDDKGTFQVCEGRKTQQKERSKTTFYTFVRCHLALTLLQIETMAAVGCYA